MIQMHYQILWPTLLTNNYLVVQVVLALEDMGAFESLRRRPMTICALAKKLSVAEELLNICFEFLWAVTNFIRKDGLVYSLADSNFPRPLFILEAYKDVFDNLAKIARGEKKYGREINRDGWYLKEATDIVTKEAIMTIIGSLTQEKEAQLIDLGCGSAESVIAFCRNNKTRTALGIDINRNIVLAAEKRVKKEGLSEQVLIVNSDIIDIDRWSGRIAADKKTIFLASTILHELLVNGEEWLAAFLRKLSVCFPNSRLFISEFDTPTFQDLKFEKDINKKLFFAMYKLWHPFTNQGMPQPQKMWEKIIVSSGWELQNIIRSKYDLLTYNCLA